MKLRTLAGDLTFLWHRYVKKKKVSFSKIQKARIYALPERCASVFLHSVSVPSSKLKQSKRMDCLVLEYGTDLLSRSVDNEPRTSAHAKSKRSKDLKHAVSEGRNLSQTWKWFYTICSDFFSVYKVKKPCVTVCLALYRLSESVSRCLC